MKILHVAHSIGKSYGGPTQSLKGFALAARRSGAEVAIVAPVCSAADSAGLDAVADELHEFRSFGEDAFSVSPALVQWVSRNARRYDVVHVHGLFNPVSSFGARAAIRKRVPTVIRPFGTLSQYTFAHRRAALKQTWFSLIERDNLRSASVMHFTTDAERDEADRHGLNFGERAWVVPPPFSPSHDSDGTAQVREPIALFLSRLHPVKNLEALIAAWPKVMARRSDCSLVIAGAGPRSYENLVRAHAASTAPEGSIEFVGFLSGEEKTRMLSRASVFVLPSSHENFGVAVLEAIFAGVPVVITPEVQLAPFVTAHGLGIVASAEPAKLAAAILDVLDDSVLRKYVSEAGASIVRNSFGLDTVGRELMAMYSSAIASNSRV